MEKIRIWDQGCRMKKIWIQDLGSVMEEIGIRDLGSGINIPGSAKLDISSPNLLGLKEPSNNQTLCGKGILGWGGLNFFGPKMALAGAQGH
jgi:hypothetical protein